QNQYIHLSYLFYSIGRLFGLIGFLFLSILIISGDTARFFDKFFGMDKIIKFQRKFAITTSVFVLTHPIFFMLANKSVFNFLLPNLTYIPLSIGIISFYVFIIVAISSKIYKRISYKLWQYIHILTYLLFFFVLYHAINLGSDYGLLSIKIIYWILFSFISIGIIYRTWYKIKAGRLVFVVKEIKWETKDTYTIILTPNKKFHFKAGQFCFLRINKEKLYARHPFTISSAPQEDTISFTVKLKGRFTKIASGLKAGERVIVEGPFGIFDIEDKKKDLVFISGGVGIAPFMSIIKDKLRSQNFQNVLLLCGAKTENDLIFKNEIDTVKETWFKKIYVLSDDSSYSGPCEKGYINKKIIEKYAENAKNSLFYICGPEPMKELCKKALFSLGVKKSDVFIESFFW
ncbi:MAG: ferric reductase-like transmembrane domain-containing protein, partial [bacterium]|nr:ferric reductase-like transmembrane domain-containing protein [bacterium]